jgi:hypothetical protein
VLQIVTPPLWIGIGVPRYTSFDHRVISFGVGPGVLAHPRGLYVARISYYKYLQISTNVVRYFL